MSIKKPTTKIKKNKFKLTSLIGLLLLVAAVLAGLYLVRQNQNMEEDASGLGCRSYNDDKDACNANCGGAKKDGSTYKCRFGKNGCVETSQKCTGGGGGEGSIKNCGSGLECTKANEIGKVSSWNNLIACKDNTGIRLCCNSGYKIGWMPSVNNGGTYCYK